MRFLGAPLVSETKKEKKKKNKENVISQSTWVNMKSLVNFNVWVKTRFFGNNFCFAH